MAARVRDVAWAESARAALDEVIAYIAQDSRQAAMQVLDAALQAAASLSTLSERGRVVPELNDPNIRETFVFRYRLMYRVEDSRVLVVAFLHGSRDFAKWRQQKQPG
jgi:toxin ParE1/3/4